ncbi:MAG: cytochrome c-type biogenesis protein CcmH [Halodesulfurarchaeum sp.]
MAQVAMNRIGRIVSVLIAISVAMGPAAAASGAGLLGQLQCPCDCGKYLSVCDCTSADTGRSYVQKLKEQGFTNAEIAEKYGQKFGDAFVEYVPKQGSGLSLWLTPLAGVIVGAGGILVYFRRFRGAPEAGPATVCPDCGTDIDESAEYCPACGSRIEDSW